MQATWLRSRWQVWVGLAALVAYAVFLGRHASVTAAGSDASGYLNSGRLLAAGKLQGELRLPPEFGDLRIRQRQHFMPLGFDLIVPGNRRLPPTYPVGLPLHLAFAEKLFGTRAAPWAVELAGALAALVLCYAMARELGTDRGLALAGATTLAAFPVFLFTSLQPLSDTLATTWCLAAAWAALRARRAERWAVLAGVAVGVAVLVRATNALLLPALLVALLPNWRRVAFAALGGVPIAAWLGYYNYTLYGGALRSGYGPIWNAFALHYGTPTLVHFAYWLAVLSPAVLLVLAPLAVWRARSRELLALGLWFGSMAGVYAFYAVSHETWWCLRFILPAFPPLIFAALLTLQSCAPTLRRTAAGLLALWAVACAAYWVPRLHVLQLEEQNRIYPAACERAKTILPPHALIATFAASGAFYYYTDFPILRTDLIQREDFADYATRASRAQRPIAAVLFDDFDRHFLSERMPGEWERIDTVGRVGIWRLRAARGPENP